MCFCLTCLISPARINSFPAKSDSDSGEEKDKRVDQKSKT